eukprot:m.372006 g.372006  ORF g.372006 m.372006 type:complete len:394 (-) comp16686_c1_seq14:4568-5749(-)
MLCSFVLAVSAGKALRASVGLALSGQTTFLCSHGVAVDVRLRKSGQQASDLIFLCFRINITRNMQTFVILCGVVATVRADWPLLCAAGTGGNPDARCPASATCCRSMFSQNMLGCCPWANATCCGNGLTCCPSGTKCVDNKPAGYPSWGFVTTCEPTDSLSAAGNVTGVAVCKYGPPLPASTTVKNVLIIGDSVSIGYTPFVASALASVALVQHAPWGGDGGAEETAYGVQCLDYFLHSAAGVPFKADLVMFNWGLHDGPQLFNQPPANVTIPGQEGPMSAYVPELTNITTRLQAYAKDTGAKLLFAITSPMLANVQADNDVLELNRRAAAIMADAGVPTVNLHSAVVGKCGAAPQPTCFNHPDCFSPHCSAEGYAWLANSTIAPAIRSQLGV